MASTPKFLTDAQVQRYIADGFIVLDTDLPSELHAEITRDLHFSLKKESRWLGDNLLPRVPSIDTVLQSDVVQGALQSLLGPDFAWAPHRFPHNSEPLDKHAAFAEDFDPFENQPVMGKGSISGSGWHQDGHSKAGRSRWHTFKAINMFYFPHDVPLEMGPTRLLAGTHLYATLREAQPSQVFHQPIKKGTVVIADFDVGHAGTPNRTATSRYMLKFVALRTALPTGPSWDHEDASWRTPDKLRTATNIPRVWELLWHWLRGDQTMRSQDALPTSAIPDLLDAVVSTDVAVRLSAMYELARIGAPAVDGLVEQLLTTANKQRHESPPHEDPGYYAMSPDHLDRRYGRRQFVPEDSAIALGLIGAPSLDALAPLLRDADPWIRINAAYAIGEIGESVPGDIADQVGALLDDDLQQVVRAAADALCWLPYSDASLERISRHFSESRSDWQEAAMGEPNLGGKWTFENQIRYALSWALLSRTHHALTRQESETLEQAIVHALPFESGYSPAVLCEALERLGTPNALKTAIHYLQPRRWDAFSFEPPEERAAA